MSEFKRERRYLVIKRKDMEIAEATLTQEAMDYFTAVCKIIENVRAAREKQPLKCVVIESDWPEYEIVWNLLQLRMDKEVEEKASTMESKE